MPFDILNQATFALFTIDNIFALGACCTHLSENDNTFWGIPVTKKLELRSWSEVFASEGKKYFFLKCFLDSSRPWENIVIDFHMRFILGNEELVVFYFNILGAAVLCHVMPLTAKIE